MHRSRQHIHNRIVEHGEENRDLRDDDIIVVAIVGNGYFGQDCAIFACGPRQIAEGAFGAGGPGILQATERQLGGPALSCIEMPFRVAAAVEASAVDRVQLQSLRPQIARCGVAAANLQGRRRQGGLHAIMRYELRKVCISGGDARIFPGLEPRCQRPFPGMRQEELPGDVGKAFTNDGIAGRAARQTPAREKPFLRSRHPNE
jgi:hypothetical protein